jgi:hypothetical protein
MKKRRFFELTMFRTLMILQWAIIFSLIGIRRLDPIIMLLVFFSFISMAIIIFQQFYYVFARSSYQKKLIGGTVIEEILETIETKNIDLSLPAYEDDSPFSQIVKSGKVIGEMNLKEKILSMVIDILSKTDLYGSLRFDQKINQLLFESMESRFPTTGVLWPVKGYYIVETHKREKVTESSANE